MIQTVCPYLSKAKIDQIKKSNKLQLTKKKKKGQDGGFLPLLIGALCSIIPTVLSSLFGKGGRQVDRAEDLQVDAQQRPYRK